MPRPRRALRCAVQDRVVVHQELDAAPRSRIALVDGTVLAREGARPNIANMYPRTLVPVALRVLSGDRRQLVLGWHLLAHLASVYEAPKSKLLKSVFAAETQGMFPPNLRLYA